jgi:hypothetical protein
MTTVQGKRGDATSGVTQKNPRNGRRCRRCGRFGTFAPNALVCDRCMGALPLVFPTCAVVRISVSVAMSASVILVGGGW